MAIPKIFRTFAFVKVHSGSCRSAWLRRLWVCLPALLCLLVVVSGCVKEDDEPVVSLGVGDAVPRFSVTLSDGSVFDYSVMQQHPCAVVFFETSCSDCRAALPVIQTVAAREDFASQGIRFVCIARAEGEASIASFWSAAGLTLPYSPQPDRSVYNLFASSVIPRVYVTRPDRPASADGDGPGVPVISAVLVEEVTEELLVSALSSL